ncbi:calymmin [Neolamprologus brichardi]|uniref:calymmin n=1 Tax=Neolamprologus brichardi TaxID=32507 RepID=UPI001643BA83|nr:calymmin [Neolamprologus brichardi]
MLAENKVGYGAVAGVHNGQLPQPNGRTPQDGGGVGAVLMPSKGVGRAMGARTGYAGYPTKGVGGYPAVLSHQNGDNSNGYPVKASPTNGQQTKGYGAQDGRYGWQGPKGNGNAAAAHGTKGNGYGAGSTGNVPNTKGQGAVAGPLTGYGTRPNGQGGAGSKPMKGYGRPPYGAGPGKGAFKGLGMPQFAGSYKGYGAQPMAGYNVGYGSAGLGLGHRYGNGWMKGPNPGYGAAAGASNGQGAKPNGYAGARAPFSNGAMSNGYGSQNGGAPKSAKPGFGNVPYGYGAKPNGYGGYRGGAVRPQPGYGKGPAANGYGPKPSGYGAAAGPGANALKGYTAKPNGHGVRNGALGGYGGNPYGYGGSKPQKTTKGLGAPSEGVKTLDSGYGGPAGVTKGQLPKAANAGYNMLPNTKGQDGKGAGEFSGKSLKGGALSPEQPSVAPLEGLSLRQAITRGAVPFSPTGGVHAEVSKEKYQKLVSPLPQEKSYKQTPLVLQVTPEPAPALPAKHPKSSTTGPQIKGEKVPIARPAQGVSQSKPAPGPAAVYPEESGRASVSKGQGAKPTKHDCGPSGVPNGQWMNIPRPDYNTGAGASMGTNTKGFIAGSQMFPGLGNGYGAGFGRGGYLGGEYRNGHTFGGYANGYSAGVQPDYASIGQVVPVPDGKSGIGIGGLQFSGQPVGTGINRAGKYGYGFSPYGAAGDGKPFGKYGYGGFPNGGQLLGLGNAGNTAGYGRLPYEAQPAGLGPETKSTGLAVSQYQPDPLGLGHNVKGKYGGAEGPYLPQAVGFDEAKSSGKYDNQGAYQSQPLETAGEAGLTYEPQPLESNSARKSYVKGELPTPGPAAEGVGRFIDGYENLGYINGRVQPQAPTPSPNLAYPSVHSRLPAESSFTADAMPGDVRHFPDLEGTAGLTLDSAPATESEGTTQVSEQPDDLPRQIHIQQHLKLHFQPQGAKDNKYDLNGFFGDTGHQG